MAARARDSSSRAPLQVRARSGGSSIALASAATSARSERSCSASVPNQSAEGSTIAIACSWASDTSIWRSVSAPTRSPRRDREPTRQHSATASAASEPVDRVELVEKQECGEGLRDDDGIGLDERQEATCAESSVEQYPDAVEVLHAT